MQMRKGGNHQRCRRLSTPVSPGKSDFITKKIILGLPKRLLTRKTVSGQPNGAV